MADTLIGVWDGRTVDERGGVASDSQLSGIARMDEYAPGNKILAVMGWDGFFIYDDRADPVDMARAYMEVVQRESCGKCVPCRMGTKVAADILTRIADGKGREEDLDTLRNVAELVRDGSMCELGHSSMVAVSALLDRYEDEFRNAIIEGRRRQRGHYHTKVTAPCIEACPERLDVPRYIEYIRSGRYADSLSVIHEKNPLASVCGRVCPRFCEFACRRGKLDDPVDIRHLKRFVSDVEMDAAVKHYEPEVAISPDAKRVAIIGAGPAGMTAAYHLLRKGYRVTVFESLSQPGGMAAVGIPDYRLPREVLQSELDVIRKMGADVHYGKRFGTDFALASLREDGYDATFLAIGAEKGRGLGVENEDSEPAGYMIGIDFLRKVNLHESIEMGRKAVVVGGGNVAMDCARCSRRLGADVHLVYRRNREAMPADKVEIQEAEEEGVVYHFLCNPTRLIVEDGSLVRVECVRMELGEPDASGRRRPVPIEGSEFIIDCDMVIPAIGQSVNADCLTGEAGLELSRRGTIVADGDTLETSLEGVFAGGDCVTGPGALIEAMAAGFRVSHSIDQYLREGKVTLTEDERLSRIYRPLADLDVDEVDRLGRGETRIDMPTRSVADRVDDFDEIETGLSPEDALLEADRCLRCYRIILVATEE